jgi:hypothetical protein
MTDGICDVCSKWYCDSQECDKRRRQKANYERYLERNDRSGYWQQRYEENKEQILAQAREWQRANRDRMNGYQRKYAAKKQAQTT